MSNYPDAPLMLVTGALGVYFCVLGIRAIVADRRGRKHESTIPPCVDEEHEDAEGAVFERARRSR